ncbi:hypothetical protein MASR2M117_00650 [Paludibacter sp.]
MTGYNWDYLDKRAYNNKVGHYKFGRQLEFIKEHGKNRFDTILDIAGGSGRFALPLRTYSEDITVIDVNSTALALLEERAENKIKIIQGDFMEVVIEYKFSLILCIEAIGYFSDWELFFKKVNRLLSIEGRFIFSYTNPNSWRFFLRKVKNWKNGFYPYHEMKISELKEMLNNCDLEIDTMEGMNWIPFSLTSNNILVSVFAFIEKVFRLRYWFAQSPWLMISVNKKTHSV